VTSAGLSLPNGALSEQRHRAGPSLHQEAEFGEPRRRRRLFADQIFVEDVAALLRLQTLCVPVTVDEADWRCACLRVDFAVAEHDDVVSRVGNISTTRSSTRVGRSLLPVCSTFAGSRI
jgi:hypothetical protein